MKNKSVWEAHGRHHDLGGCQDWCARCHSETGSGKCATPEMYAEHCKNKKWVTGKKKCCRMATDAWEREELRSGLAHWFAVLEKYVGTGEISAAQFRGLYKEAIALTLQHCFDVHTDCDPEVCPYHAQTKCASKRMPAFVTCKATQQAVVAMLEEFFSDENLHKLVMDGKFMITNCC